uniref:hypothetical protein n=1 Tax=Acetatifactor sp. TaxID=1872090 RepID=UPI004057A865
MCSASCYQLASESLVKVIASEPCSKPPMLLGVAGDGIVNNAPSLDPTLIRPSSGKDTAKTKGVHCEVESEGSWRQISGLTNRNHIRL